MRSLLLLFVSLCAAAKLATKPQMGWNSYNAYKNNINQTIIQSTANALINTGMAAAGYKYLLLDDGWADNRDSQGRQQANQTRFPNGIGPVADYVHQRDLKIGIYSDAGILGCSFHPGSWGYEELDAYTFASWGIDYLKYDNCGGFQADTLAPAERYLRMAQALQGSGREIFYSLCEWGNQFPWLWADQLSDSYRISGDIHASFSQDNPGICETAYCLNTGYAGVSVLTLIRKMREISYFQKPGSWGDMDLLEIGNGAMSEIEEQTHFTFWAALKSPLIASTNLDTISASSLVILTNKEIIALSQDDAGVAVNYISSMSKEGSTQIWAGPLRSGASRFVILALNEANDTQTINITASRIPGFSSSVKGHYTVRDVWPKKDLEQNMNHITLESVSAHQTKVLVFSTE